MNKFSFLLLGMLVLNFLFTACDKKETVLPKVNDQKENSKSRPLEIVKAEENKVDPKLPEPSAEEIDGPSEEEVLGAQMSDNENPFDGNDPGPVEMYLPTEEEERRAQAAIGDGPFPEDDGRTAIPADFPLSWTELIMKGNSGEPVIPIYCSGRTQTREIIENGMQVELLIKMPQEDVKYIIDRIENPGPETYQIYYKGGTGPIGAETVYYDNMVGVAQWGGQYYVADEFKQKFSNVRVEKCN